MKNVAIAVAILLTVPGLTLANGSGAGIVSSPHDFSAEAWNHRGEICRVCHVPHDHNRNESLFMNGLLWNHDLSSATYMMYAEYNDPSFTSFIDNAFETEPIGVAKMCLGCHDGTVAVDNFDSKSLASGAPLGAFFIGQDWDPGFQVPGPDITPINGDLNLLGTHPMSIQYGGPSVDPGLNPTSTPINGGPLTIADVLDNGRVQCSSCHDVHDAPGESVPNTHLLRAPQTVAQGGTASQLCLTCHLK